MGSCTVQRQDAAAAAGAVLLHAQKLPNWSSQKQSVGLSSCSCLRQKLRLPSWPEAAGALPGSWMASSTASAVATAASEGSAEAPGAAGVLPGAGAGAGAASSGPAGSAPGPAASSASCVRIWVSLLVTERTCSSKGRRAGREGMRVGTPGAGGLLGSRRPGALAGLGHKGRGCFRGRPVGRVSRGARLTALAAVGGSCPGSCAASSAAAAAALAAAWAAAAAEAAAALLLLLLGSGGGGG
jgi:hypothetical protein